ncbi:DUF4199 domain-containing protein [Mucilaginibacter terrenus]|uniref:DUF4199 domain-containing protein n=1 Tax=Mucilaginibacter terrenus TaxID=2482727 RepID=A0A3E2NVG1_9SPHI|nr:DUF4199 domain-containing protein [Mucilaginibacter terrenus]RFZ84995.1 DUF4199 domain-containing protein [Mucilaginibacter terrenus]
MKRNVIVFGLISGLLISAFTVCTMAMCYNSGTLESSMVIGFSAMILALSLIFVAVKNYRDKYNGGVVSFGKAFQIGLLISLIASTMYTLSWAIEYHVFIPDWFDKYTAHALRDLRNSGKSATEIAAKTRELNEMKVAYQNPLIFAAYTYLEIFPVGVIVSLIAALILKRRQRPAHFATV